MKKSDLICTIKIKDRRGNVIGEKDVVKYEGLLAKAHDEGLKSITSKLVQAPDAGNGNLAIVTARVETLKGVFEAIGDASPENVSSFVSAHVIRMAETRAKARALRDAVNIGTVSVEELVADALDDGILEDEQPTGGNGDAHPTTHQNHTRQSAPMTDAQRRYLFRLMAERGFGADQAREQLHKLFGIESLEQASKYDASNLIDQLQRGLMPETVGEA